MITYFFALFPTAAEAVETYAEADRLRARYGMRGALTGLRKLHLTVHFVGRRDARDVSLERRLSEIGDELRLTRYDFSLAAAATFRRSSSAPSIFLLGIVPEQLRTLAADLRQRAADVADPSKQNLEFAPHVTWMRSRDAVPGVVTTREIHWRPSSLALVAGHSDALVYEVVRCWPLPDIMVATQRG